MCASQRQLSGVKKNKTVLWECYWDNPNCPLGEKKNEKNWLFTERSLLQDCCYKIADVPVKEFQRKKYLSVPEKGTIEQIDDIDDVAEMESDDEQLTAAVVVKGVVKAVLSCQEYL